MTVLAGPVVLYTTGVLQGKQGAKHGTSRCNIHLCLWTLEAIANVHLCQGGTEQQLRMAVHAASWPMPTINSWMAVHTANWPRPAVVVLECFTKTNLVPMSGGVERGTVQGHSHTQHSLSPPPGQIGDLPNVDWPVAGGLDGLDVQGYVAVVVLEFFDGLLDFNNGIFRGYSSGMGLRLHSLHLGHVVSQLPGQLRYSVVHMVEGGFNAHWMVGVVRCQAVGSLHLLQPLPDHPQVILDVLLLMHNHVIPTTLWTGTERKYLK